MSSRTPEPGHRHTAFGLTFASEIPLPELPLAAPGVDADVHVRLGEVSPALADSRAIEPGVSARPGTLLIDFETARFLVTQGRNILVQPNPGTPDNEVRAYLLGSAMGALLHQRGLLPLHANAIEIDGRAIAFAGPSGSGKSTLAAYFRARGRRLLSDDVCAVSFGPGGEALAWPGVPRIKLWSDALQAFGHRPGDLERVVSWEDKYSLPLAMAAPGPLRLTRIYLLRTVQADPRIEAVTGAAAFDAVASNIYRSEFAAPLGRAESLFARSLSLVRATSLFVAERRLGFDVYEAEADRLERHIADRLPTAAGEVSFAGRSP